MASYELTTLKKTKAFLSFTGIASTLIQSEKKSPKAREDTQSAVNPLKGNKNRKATQFSGLHSRMTKTF